MQTETDKILIVDDNPRNVEVAAQLLSGHNYDVEFATNGEEALEWTKNEMFDLILMDVMMPGMDGFETSSRIKEMKEHEDVPIIFLTAKTDTGSLTKAFKSGGQDYISKPFRPDELMARVSAHVELRRRRRELQELNEHLEEKVRERTRELEEANRKLEKAMKELETLDNAKTNFLHMASHEIRTPLNGILGGLELIKNSRLLEDFASYIELLDMSAQRLEHFSFLSLHISEIQTNGKSLFELKTYPLTKAIREFISEYFSEKNSASKRLILNAPEKEIKATIDLKYFSKVMEIVIDNALNFSPPKGLINIEVEKENGVPVCIIKDTGPGFPESMLAETFSNFIPGIIHQDMHTGLNLQYAYTIMRTFDGDLQINNDPGAVVKLIFQPSKR